jgi:hypothetical protein
MTERPSSPPRATPRKSLLRSFLRWSVVGVVALWSLAALVLVAAPWIDPPTTAVHIQRRLQAWIHTSRIKNTTNSFRSAKSPARCHRGCTPLTRTTVQALTCSPSRHLSIRWAMPRGPPLVNATLGGHSIFFAVFGQSSISILSQSPAFGFSSGKSRWAYSGKIRVVTRLRVVHDDARCR